MTLAHQIDLLWITVLCGVQHPFRALLGWFLFAWWTQ